MLKVKLSILGFFLRALSVLRFALPPVRSSSVFAFITTASS